MLVYILFVIGFFFLIKGAGLLIDGASFLAKRFNLSELFIGLTVVAFGTSAPELFINILANFNGANDLAWGNVLGASISNILLISGLAALACPLKIKSGQSWKELPLALSAVILLLLLANDFFLRPGQATYLGQLDGLLLVIFFLVFLYYTLGRRKTKVRIGGPAEVNLALALTYVLVGVIGLAIGGNWVVAGAMALAEKFHLSQALIGLTIVSIGTTLPELAASLTAAFKKRADIAIGNIVGSTIFNLALILGLSSLLNPLSFNSRLNWDILTTCLAILLVWFLLIIGKKKQQIDRHEGALLIAVYLLYVVFLVVRD